MNRTSELKSNELRQPIKYSQSELNKLKNFIAVVKNDEKRSQLVCWGNSFNKGY